MSRAPHPLLTVAWMLAATVALACAGGSPVRDSPAAAAVPEPDPACRGTVQDRMLAHGLEQVVVRVSVDRLGSADVVEIVAPHVTPAAAEEIRAALEGCPWAPPSPPGPAGAYVTTVRIRAR